MEKNDNKFLNKKNKRSKKSGKKKSKSPRKTPKNAKNEITSKVSGTNLNPKSFKFIKNLADIQDLNPYCNYVIFTSINNILYLVYASGDFSITCYDLNNNLKINEIKNCHSKNILSLEHIYDKENKKNLILSLSNDNNIKLWDIDNLECILNIKGKIEAYEVFKYEVLSSCCFFQDKNKTYIVMSRQCDEMIEIYDIKGNIIKKFGDSWLQKKICPFYDKYLDKGYIISLKLGKLISYDFISGEIFRTYDKIEKFKHILNYHSILIICEKDLTRLIAIDGWCVNIWNFYSGQNIKKINIYFGKYSYSKNVCLWNNKCLLMIYNPSYVSDAGKENNSIFLVDLEKGTIKKNIITFKKFYLFFISRLIHPIYGECLMTFGYDYIFKLFKEK
jgi:WD40 repeat protein